MLLRGILPRILIPVIVLVSSLSLGFFFRPPVIFLTDDFFTGIYGPERALWKRIKLSLSLYRRIIIIPVAENSGPDVIALVIEDAETSPYAVVLSYRYYEGVLRYREKFPQVSMCILGGRRREDRTELTWAATDTLTDFYRAGLCAAILASGRDGSILFSHDDSVLTDEKEAFIAGLREQGYNEDPIFISNYLDASVYQNAACAVLTGNAGHFFEKNSDTPAVLFSWVDPGMCPRNVRVIFDDSPWALMSGALKGAGKRDSPPYIPSELIITRVPEKDVLRKLKGFRFVKPTETKTGN